MRLKALMVIFLVLLTVLGCAAVGNPKVNTLPADDIPRAPIVLADFVKQFQIPTGWIGGVIFQERWQTSYGLDSDEHNRVELRVYIPNKLVYVIPCSPRQEKGFVEDYDPGDIIAMAWDGTSRVGASQDTVRLCKEDVIMLKKGGARSGAQ